MSDLYTDGKLSFYIFLVVLYKQIKPLLTNSDNADISGNNLIELKTEKGNL